MEPPTTLDDLIYDKLYDEIKRGNVTASITDFEGNRIRISNTRDTEADFTGFVFKHTAKLGDSKYHIYKGDTDIYLKAVTIDHDNNIIVIGNQFNDTEGLGKLLITKFDSELNIITQQHYDLGEDHENIRAIVIDADNNIIGIGNGFRTGIDVSIGIVIKFNTDLQIIDHRYYENETDVVFTACAFDGKGIICVGHTNNITKSASKALIVKLDNNLDVLRLSTYISPHSHTFRQVTILVDGVIRVEGYPIGLAKVSRLPHHELIDFDSNLEPLCYTSPLSHTLTSTSVL